MKKTLKEIIEWMFTEDDKKRKKIEYDLGDIIDKGINKIRNLKLKELLED